MSRTGELRFVVLQACFCGWIGEVEEQRVVGDGEQALECPNCGRHDRLEWISPHLREALLQAAAERAADIVQTDSVMVAD